jgi:hypothetical protein
MVSEFPNFKKAKHELRKPPQAASRKLKAKG